MNDLPAWVWVLTALGAVSALASTGNMIDAVLGAALWFAIAAGIASLIRRRQSGGDEQA